jgi:hypothetical protein
MVVAAAAAGPPYLRDFVPDLAVIPAQTMCDFLDREAANEHVAQLAQRWLRPFPGDRDARHFGVSVGGVTIEHRGANQAQERVLFGMRWPAQECADFDIRNLTAERRIRLVPDEGRAGRGVAG